MKRVERHVGSDVDGEIQVKFRDYLWPSALGDESVHFSALFALIRLLPSSPGIPDNGAQQVRR